MQFRIGFLAALFAASLLRAQTDIDLLGAKSISFDERSPARSKMFPLDAKAPKDWTGYSWVAVELRSSTPQPFQFKVKTAQGVNVLSVTPIPGSWSRVYLPLDMIGSANPRGTAVASFHYKGRPSYGMANFGPWYPLRDVQSIGFDMETLYGKAQLEVRHAKLSKAPKADDRVLDNTPVIDEFGQFIHEDWPGKLKSEADLKRAIEDERASLKPGDFGYSKFGGYVQGPKRKATGFFRVENVNGKWWLVDPEGYPFFSTGVAFVDPRVEAPYVGREYLFAKRPPMHDLNSTSEHLDDMVDYGMWNTVRAFGKDWKQPWADLSLRRIHAWGFNTAGSWTAEPVKYSGKIAYAQFITGWPKEYHGLGDVYAPDFAEKIEANAKPRALARRDDPWMIGYYLSAGAPWAGFEVVMAQHILDGPDTATKRELQKALAAGDTPPRRKAFMDRAYAIHMQTLAKAMRKFDPNHLVMGVRMGATHQISDAMLQASSAFDVISVSFRKIEPGTAAEIARITRTSGRPVILETISTGVSARGMTGGPMAVRTHAERGTVYRSVLEKMAVLPEVVGFEWFSWADQPTAQRDDGQNRNCGIIDVTGRPYADLVQAMKATHAGLYRIRSGNAQISSNSR